MKTLKIVLNSKLKLSEKIYKSDDDNGRFQMESTYQPYVFILLILDQSYVPFQNLQQSDFTFNFLRRASQISINAPLFSIAYKADVFDEHGVTVPGGFIQHPNPIVSKGSWYYIARVQQLIKEQFFTEGIQTDEVEYPADRIEIIINSLTADALGDGIFLLD